MEPFNDTPTQLFIHRVISSDRIPQRHHGCRRGQEGQGSHVSRPSPPRSFVVSWDLRFVFYRNGLRNSALYRHSALAAAKQKPRCCQSPAGTKHFTARHAEEEGSRSLTCPVLVEGMRRAELMNATLCSHYAVDSRS